MRKSIVFFIATVVFNMSLIQAQDHISCDGMRYRTAVFEEVIVKEDIQFSNGETIGEEKVDLFLDVYEPKGDGISTRPTIILGFGGSFITGSRKDIALLCEAYAKRGFVAVSIDYRLYDLPLFPPPAAEQMEVVVVKSMVDMRAALSFLVSDARNSNAYGVDTTQFFIGGVSAGSIMALHTAMLDFEDAIPTGLASKLDNNGPIDGITNTNSFIPIQGVINFSGGLNNGDWIDGEDPALFSYHDEMDPTVPYKSGFAYVFGQNIIGIDGSFVLDSIARARGVTSELVSVPNSMVHVSYLFVKEQRDKAVDESAKFMYKMLCSDRASVIEAEVDKPYNFGPNPSENSVFIDIRGEGKISLYDLTGRLLTTQSILNSGVFNLQDFVPGTYVVKIKVGEKAYSEKIIKE